MQAAANQKLARNRSRLAWGLYVAAMVIFILGLFVNNGANREASFEAQLTPWATIAVGLLLWFTALSQLRRWGPRGRQEKVLAGAMSGLDDRYKLYAFLAASLPDFILVGPGGVLSLVAKAETGSVVCTKDRWKRAGSWLTSFAFDSPLGNPSAEAVDDIKRLRTVLDQAGLHDVPVGALVVFTNDRVKVKLEGCSYPVTRLKTLRDTLLKLTGRGKAVALSAAQVRAVRDVFDRRLDSARSWR
ncbi:MAG: hypothetical protein HYX52_06830 [Chloroflexi bacterium]|nr:hypothetical protein [Chloroflexota bacterium]